MANTVNAFWESSRFSHSGRIIFEFPDVIPTDQPFDFTCNFYYDSHYREGEMVSFQMEGIAKNNELHLHVVARKKLLTCNQQFQISIDRGVKGKWCGEYSSIGPSDWGEIRTSN